MTARQLAEVLQVSQTTIHRLRRAGRIPAVMVTDKLVRFNLRDVARALTPRHAAHDGGTEPEDQRSPQLSFNDLDLDF